RRAGPALNRAILPVAPELATFLQADQSGRGKTGLRQRGILPTLAPDTNAGPERRFPSVRLRSANNHSRTQTKRYEKDDAVAVPRGTCAVTGTLPGAVHAEGRRPGHDADEDGRGEAERLARPLGRQYFRQGQGLPHL